MRTIVCALLGLSLIGGAAAKDSDWKAFRTAYVDTLELLEDERRADSKVTLLATLEGHVDKMCKVDQQKTVKFLFETELAELEPDVGRVVLKSLGKLSAARAVDELAKRTHKASVSTQSLVLPVLAKLEAPSALRAVLKSLKDKRPAVRRAAIQGLGGLGAKALDKAAGPLKGLLRKGPRRERWLVADALEAITGTRPEGFPKSEANPETTLPSVWAMDRVLFVVEWSPRAAESVFLNPFKEPEAEDDSKQDKGKKGKKGKGEAEGPETLSALGLTILQVEAAINALPDGVTFQVVRYGDRPRSFSDSYERGGEKAAGEVREWLEGSPNRGPRNLKKALEWVYDAEDEPDAVFVFTAGLPNGPKANVDQTLEAVQTWAWGRDVRVNLLGFWLPPEKEPSSEVAKEKLTLEEGNYRRLVHALAAAGHGEFRMHTLNRPVASDDGADSTAGSESGIDFPLDQKLSSSQFSQLKRALKTATGSEAERLISGAGGCPELKVARLVYPALIGGDLALGRAAIAGIGRNKEPRVLNDVKARLLKERGMRQQLRMLRAIGANSAPEAALALVQALPKLSGDALRVAWRLLSERTGGDLTPHAEAIVRAARGLEEGLTYRYAIQTVAKANGKAAPPRAGLDVGSNLLLPERFAGSGVALLIDAHRDVTEPFWSPPKPVEKPADAEAPAPPKKPKKPKKPAEPAEVLEPVSRKQAMQKELGRALDVLFAGEQAVHLRTLSGRSWKSGSTPLTKRNVLEDARAWVDDMRVGKGRDAAAALREALDDPQVEEIYLLACGVPRASPGAREPGDLLDAVAEQIDARQVTIHVILPVGTKQADTAEYRDFLGGLDAVYRPLAEATGGSVFVRHSIEGVPK